ncbi:MAG: 2,3-bisphosphoglycerate-dependent phosphoglycerate mutase [Pseudonocardiales bacterium]|jgi:broad specificity phosphatase PhoE|nr:2,3-bisphosphoglycerate-dependent phosphoglycerate mutase [Pseudonocardiales bacterium]
MAAAELILVRHGESTGNVAREHAEATGAEVIEVAGRDADVGLTELGARQAQLLGRFLRTGTGAAPPTSVWSSPYARARQTAEWAISGGELGLRPHLDERLRDKELGILDTLTSHGVRVRYPLEDQRRRWLGKFYYRAPGGESWADLALRLRSFMLDLDRLAGGERVLVVTHDAVISVLRYVCEGLDETQLLELARSQSLVNTGITRMARDERGLWRVTASNAQDHLLPAFAGADLRTEHPAGPVHHPAGSAGPG